MKQNFWNRKGVLVICGVLCLSLLAGCGVMRASALTEAGAPARESTQTAGLVGEEAAKQAALERVGLGDAVFTEVEYDAEDGVYELEFHDGVTEYEAEVDAFAAAVVKLEQEPLETHDCDDWDDDCDDGHCGRHH